MTTREVVQRVLPLLERLSPRTLDKARLLQYLAARASVDWGLLAYVKDDDEDGARVAVFRDSHSQAERRVRYPDCLPAGLERDVVAEYKRLALAKPLTSMQPRLFEHFFRQDYCARCRYDLSATRQVCRECYFAGRPVSFEPA